MADASLVNVFAAAEGGGNPTPIVLDASGYDEARMLQVTRSFGLESAFVFPPTDPGRADFRLRFFVPRQEMNMCGHATLGTFWLLRRAGRFTGSQARIETGSGLVRSFVQEVGAAQEYVEITQPAGRLQAITSHEARGAILDVLGITEGELSPLPIYNAVTSRRRQASLRRRSPLDSWPMD